VRRTYRELGGHLGDVVAMMGSAREIVPLPFLPDARACLDDAIARGRGVVFASAHLGPWERVAASLVASGVPLTVVAREAYDPRFTRLYERLRGQRGVRTVYRGAGGAATALLRVLRGGGVLGIPMDLASRVASVDAPFLGSPAATPVGPARIALRTGAAVVVGTAAPQSDGSLGIAITPIATSDLDATSDSAAAELLLTGRINAELSARVRALPEAWVWMHPRWSLR
jgi:KDO2-lipid IV(A) lauroyltransferase